MAESLRAVPGGRFGRLTAVLTVALLVWCGMSPGAAARGAVSGATAVVRTADGAVRGSVHRGYRTFEGIPYAAPPVGRRRWAPPRPVTRWRGVLDATRPRSACPQTAGEVPGGSTDEDCLRLHVTAPATAAPAHPKPVLVWLPGGGFITGAGQSYDAHRMAIRGDIVVVTVNYRLGALGFLALPGLRGAGTFGLADQQAALRWVRDRIRAFGGDPGNVTLAGESAGGFSVCAQLVSPGSIGLFRRAVIESGPCTGAPARPFGPSAAPLASAERDGTALARKTGCGGAADVLGCLRRLPVSRLLAAQGEVRPAYGTPLLPRDVAAAVTAGAVRRVPVLIGANHDEGNGWAAAALEGGAVITPRTWPQTVASFFPDPSRAAAVVRTYPVRSARRGGPVFGALLDDWNYACPTLRTQHLLRRQVPVWAYEFADEHAPPVTVPGKAPFPLGAVHAAELPYLFDLGGRPAALTADQRRLSDSMIAAWTRFARTGDPNGPGTRRWPTTGVLSLTPQHTGPARDIGTRHHCPFWQTFP